MVGKVYYVVQVQLGGDFRRYLLGYAQAGQVVTTWEVPTKYLGRHSGSHPGMLPAQVVT